MVDDKSEGSVGLSRHVVEHTDGVQESNDGARCRVHVRSGACARDGGPASNSERKGEPSDICAFWVGVDRAANGGRARDIIRLAVVDGFNQTAG